MSTGRVRLKNIAARDVAPLVGAYICDPDSCIHAAAAPERTMLAARLGREGYGHCWHESAARRLKWQGGPSAVAADDLVAWNSLGSGKRAAA